MDSTLLLYASLSLLNAGISTYVYLRNPSQLINKVFGFFGLATGAWILTIGLAHNPLTANLLLVRSTFVSASLMLLALVTLFLVFPSSPFPRTPSYAGFAALTLFFSAISFSPLLVTDVHQGPNGLILSYGHLHRVFGLFVYASLAYSLLLLWQKLRAASGYMRLQLRYLMLGLLLPGLAVTITNLFIPLVFNVSRFGRYGPAFSLVFVALTAHIIIRHRLMNIHLVIRRSVVWLLAVATASAVFVGVAGITTSFTFARPRDLPLWLQLAFVLLIALLLEPLRRWIQRSMNRYLYRESYDYQRTIREASRTIASILDLTSVTTYVCNVVARTLRPETVSLYLKNTGSTSFVRTTYRTFLEQITVSDGDSSVPGASPLPNTLARTGTYLFRDDIHRNTLDPTNRQALQQITDLNAEIALPILHEDQLIGFLLLGTKLSGDPFFTEDIDLLTTLVSQAAIAIRNAQLYQEVTLVQEYVANIVTTMESGVIALDAAGKVSLFNPAAERITGLPANDLRSASVSSLPNALSNPLHATLSDGQQRTQAETAIYDTTGRYVPISCSTYPLRDRLGTLLGAVVVFTDLSRLKELEGERRRAERLASFSALASGVAHEIKNPLVAIRTFAELLPDRFTEEDFRDDFSKVVIREIQRIDDLVARLRSLASPALHRLEPLDLREPIEDTLSLLRAQLEQKKISVHRSYDSTIPLISGDSPQLKQLFLNLFMNALDAMHTGGQLTIRLHQDSKRTSPTLLVDISDTGNGIIEPLLSKIFDPFVTTKPEGSGLGLAICRRIADAHGATIRAENNPSGPGCTVTVEFPIALAVATPVHT